MAAVAAAVAMVAAARIVRSWVGSGEEPGVGGFRAMRRWGAERLEHAGKESGGRGVWA